MTPPEFAEDSAGRLQCANEMQAAAVRLLGVVLPEDLAEAWQEAFSAHRSHDAAELVARGERRVELTGEAHTLLTTIARGEVGVERSRPLLRRVAAILRELES